MRNLLLVFAISVLLAIPVHAQFAGADIVSINKIFDLAGNLSTLAITIRMTDASVTRLVPAVEAQPEAIDPETGVVTPARPAIPEHTELIPWIGLININPYDSVGKLRSRANMLAELRLIIRARHTAWMDGIVRKPPEPVDPATTIGVITIPTLP